MTNEQKKELETKQWVAKRFDIPIEDVAWYHSGICYDRVGIKTKESADKVTAAVKGQTANGGMFDGMSLGGQSLYSKGTPEEHYDIMC